MAEQLELPFTQRRIAVRTSIAICAFYEKEKAHREYVQKDLSYLKTLQNIPLEDMDIFKRRTKEIELELQSQIVLR